MTGRVDAVGFAGAVDRGGALDVARGALVVTLFRTIGGLARRGCRGAGGLAATGSFVTSIEGLVVAGAARETFPIVMKSGGGSGGRSTAQPPRPPHACGSAHTPPF